MILGGKRGAQPHFAVAALAYLLSGKFANVFGRNFYPIINHEMVIAVHLTGTVQVNLIIIVWCK